MPGGTEAMVEAGRASEPSPPHRRSRRRGRTSKPAAWAVGAVALAALLGSAMLIGSSATASTASSERAGGAEVFSVEATRARAAKAKRTRAYRLTRRYVIRFHPRWYTYTQATLTPSNRLIGPIQVSPIWGIVVAPNVDTIYTSALLNLRQGPQILTIPETDATYSILSLDVYGSLIETDIPARTPGTYGLVGPDWRGSLPPGVQRIRVPYNASEWIIRADKHAADGTSTLHEAEEFRRSLHLASLSAYEQDPTSGAALVVPEQFYSPRLKESVAESIERRPTTYLRQLQEAMRSRTTRPLSRSDRRLSNRFNALMSRGGGLVRSWIILATQVAYSQIIDRWESHTGPTQWIHFDNIANWGRRYLDRAALTEYIQLGNGAQTASYFDAFTDRRALPLDASVTPAYTLTFPADAIPQAERFWSLTAYVPGSITLVPNSADKYVVGSYTRGLERNDDGSITIFMQPQRPVAAPEANWLPIPEGQFNVLLRIYGPTGNTAPGGDYRPPAIVNTFRR